MLKNHAAEEIYRSVPELFGVLENRELSIDVSVIINISMTGEIGRDVAQSGSAHAWGA
jgi:hypothetical protein